MNQFVLSISMNGAEPVQCLADSSAERALGLSEQGITWHETAELWIERDENNEIVVIGNIHCTAELTRNGRILSLAGKHIRLLAQDTINIGATVYHIENVYRCATMPKTFNIKRLTKSAMKVAAATLIASAFVACSNKTLDTSTPGAVAEPPVQDDRTMGKINDAPSDDAPNTNTNTAEPTDIVIPEPPQDIEMNRLGGEPPEPSPTAASIQEELVPVVTTQELEGDVARIIPVDQNNQNKENADQAKSSESPK